MSLRNYKGPSGILLPPEQYAECNLCHTSIHSPLYLGERYQLKDLVVHHYCVLFSAKIKQNGQDHEGVWGFLYEDIKELILLNSKKVCIHCLDEGATIRCETCQVPFHKACGILFKSQSIFKGNFSTYCKQHRPKKDIPLEVLENARKTSPICVVCMDSVDINNPYTSIWAPCCKLNWYHSFCLQELALSQAAFFKCAVCSNKKEFNEWVADCGLYIPERDASWELEPEAFASHRVQIECSLEDCGCPRGKRGSIKNSSWLLLACTICGSKGSHIRCANLKINNKQKPQWQCSECREILTNINNEPASSSQSIDVASETGNVGVPPETIDVISEREDVGPETVDVVPERIDVSSETLDPVSDIVDVCSETIDVGLETVDVSPEIVDVGSETVYVGPETVDLCSETVDVMDVVSSVSEPHTFLNQINDSGISCNYHPAPYSLRKSLTLRLPFKCNFKFCPDSFNTSIELLNHQVKHTPFKCDFKRCHAAFTTKFHLITHLKENHTSNRYSCDVPNCNLAFTRLSRLTVHKKSHEEPADTHVTLKLYTCNHGACSHAFTKYIDLWLHQQNHLSVNNIDNVTDNKKIKRHKCEYAGCGKAFHRPSVLSLHQQKEHSVININDDTNKKDAKCHKCNYLGCGKIFTHSYHLSLHQQKHYSMHNIMLEYNKLRSKDLRPYKCRYAKCNRSYTRPYDLSKHQRMQHANKLNIKFNVLAKPYICGYPKCRNAFNRPSLLIIHQKTYHGGTTKTKRVNRKCNEPYKCKYSGCRKAYARPEYLSKHQKMYHGVTTETNTVNNRCNLVAKPYICELSGCGKSFARSVYLSKHQRKYHGVTKKTKRVNKKCNEVAKPYKCVYSGCSKVFTSPSLLSMHQQEHNRVVESFSDSALNTFKGFNPTLDKTANLKSDQPKVTVVKPFKCKYGLCDAAFLQSTELVSHQRDCCYAKSLLQSHQTRHEKDTPAETFSIPPNHSQNKKIHAKGSKTPFHCSFGFCKAVFKTPAALKIHQSKHSRDGSYKCNIDNCNAIFNIKAKLLIHQARHSKKVESTPPQKELFKCSYGLCKAVFIRSTDLESHTKRLHAGAQSINIGNNNVACSSTSNLLQHQERRVKRDNRPYKCSYGLCRAAFKQPTELEIHRARHLSYGNYKCEINSSNETC